MGGNALNREDAALCLINAEAEIENICEACSKAAENIFTINEGYVGASSSDSVTQAYDLYFSALRNVANNMGNNMADFHRNLLNVINSGAESDEQFVKIEYHIATGVPQNTYNSGIKFNKEMAGIRDFNETINNLKVFNQSIENIVEISNNLIQQYKNLWELGNKCNNKVLKETAHDAAEVVRSYIRGFSELMNKANEKFMSAIQRQVDYHESASGSVKNSIDALQQSFNNLEFNVLPE